MQMIMPAVAPTLALSSAPTLIPSSFITHPVPDGLIPSSCSSPTTGDHLPGFHSSADPPACTDAPLPDHPDLLLTASVYEPPASPLRSSQPRPAAALADQCLLSHSCKICSRSFSCSRALGGHMHAAHGSFYDLCEGAGSSADNIMPKVGDSQNSDQKQTESIENEVLIDLSSDCKSENDDQYEDGELMYVLRRNPKRSRRFADQDITNEEEAFQNRRNIDGDDPEFGGRILIPPAERYKKPMLSCKLQDTAPPACTECGKEFNSWKALFGHMRCHPEREWRGIQPPAEYVSSMKVHSKDSISRNVTMESNRYIVALQPLQQASKHELLRRKEIVNNQFRSTQPASHSHDHANKANYIHQSREDAGLADDSMAGACMIRGEEKLQWSSCRKQVMLEEEEESDTESIEAAYISSNKGEDDKSCQLHLLASFSRGKRSKRSHFTVKSLRSVQDQLGAAKVVVDEAQLKEEDLEMANCLVMLAFAGSVKGKKQEVGITASKSDGDGDDEGGNGDDDDDEVTVDDQLRLACVASNDRCTAAVDDQSKTDTSNPDGANAGLEGGKYECTACKRSFKSHQALGGHRASHKKVKGCFAKTAADVEASPAACKDGIPTTSTYLDTSILSLAGIYKDQMGTASTHLGISLPERNIGDCKELIATSSTYHVGISSTSGYDVSGGQHVSGGGGVPNTAQGTSNYIAESGPLQVLGVGGRPSKLALHNTSKFHQCSICQRVFSSGQALGGHKRCHWAADKADRPASMSVISEMGAGIPTMACVATPPAMAEITFFTRPLPAATHQVKVLDLDLNLPAPLDIVVPRNSPNANVNVCTQYNSTLGSLLSLGQSSSVTNHGPIDLVDDDSSLMTGHRIAPAPAVHSGTSSPSSTTSTHISEIGPC